MNIFSPCRTTYIVSAIGTVKHYIVKNMASAIELTEPMQSSLYINPLSDLYNHEKVRVLGSGGFGKVYLLRPPKVTDVTKVAESNTEFLVNNTRENLYDGRIREVEFAAKMQGFSGGPALNRREASILKRLVNSEVLFLIYPNRELKMIFSNNNSRTSYNYYTTHCFR